MNNDNKYKAYKLLNRFGYYNVFMVKQPLSRTDVFVFGREGCIPSILLKGSLLCFYSSPIHFVLSGEASKPFLSIPINKKYSAMKMDDFATQIGQLLCYNNTYRVFMRFPAHDLQPDWYVSSVCFIHKGEHLPLFTPSHDYGSGAISSPMYYLDGEYQGHMDYIATMYRSIGAKEMVEYTYKASPNANYN